MQVRATDSVCGHIYRLNRGSAHPGTYYTRATVAERDRLRKRLRARAPQLVTTQELRDLAAADADAAGAAVLMKRYCRTVPASTKSRRETVAWVNVPLDYHLRRVQRRPGYR